LDQLDCKNCYKLVGLLLVFALPFDLSQDEKEEEEVEEEEGPAFYV
jgi:hypothetical protein